MRLTLTAVLMVVVWALMAGALLMSAREVRASNIGIEDRAKVDTIYQILIGSDSLSVLNISKRSVMWIDSLCVEWSGLSCKEATS